MKATNRRYLVFNVILCSLDPFIFMAFIIHIGHAMNILGHRHSKFFNSRVVIARFGYPKEGSVSVLL